MKTLNRMYLGEMKLRQLKVPKQGEHPFFYISLVLMYFMFEAGLPLKHKVFRPFAILSGILWFFVGVAATINQNPSALPKDMILLAVLTALAVPIVGYGYGNQRWRSVKGNELDLQRFVHFFLFPIAAAFNILLVIIMGVDALPRVKIKK